MSKEIGLYYDNPQTTNKGKLRFDIGYIINDQDDKKSNDYHEIADKLFF